jgi:malate dehydrogenase (oxaloacetate-decarboxylating)
MNDLNQRSLALHERHRGKLSITSKVPLQTIEDLALAYSPGVAEPCRQIALDKDTVYRYTNKGNAVLVVSDGSAVLGLGGIGPEAALPVMEGKAILFKAFADVDAYPIVLDTHDPDEIIDAVKAIHKGFGGVNLEDIAAPQCVYIERRLKRELDIPVFHDDQHGTAIVTLAALLNACRYTKRNMVDLKVVLIGTGAAGSSIARLLHLVGVRHIHAFNKQGVVHEDRYNTYSFLEQELLDDGVLASPDPAVGSLADLVRNQDVIIGVSTANLVTPDMIRLMHKDPIVFAMANPDPEIPYEDALRAGACIVGTGRSDYPNQINNVLAFPGLFRGALDARAQNITEEMKIASAHAIADLISDEALAPDYILPSPLDPRVAPAVSRAVQAIHTKNGTR